MYENIFYFRMYITNMEESDIKERVVRLMFYILLSFIVVRYFLNLNLTDTEYVKIVLATSVCFMFVNTYYPVIVRP